MAIIKIQVASLPSEHDATEVAQAMNDVIQEIVALPGFPGAPSVTWRTEEEG